MTIRFPSRTRLAALLIVLALVSATAGFLTTAPVDAEPAHGTHVKVFDNCINRHQIGYRYFDCDGDLVSWWGQQTGGCYQSNTYGCQPEL